MIKKFWNWYVGLGNRGGGREQETEIVQPPAPPPIEKTPAEISQEWTEAFRTTLPQVRELFPQQAGLYDVYLNQLQQAMVSPDFMTPEEQQAQEQIRGREQERLRTGILTAANIGGGLYGGRTERRVERGMGELAQAYAQQDIQNRIARQQALYGQVAPQAAQIPQMATMGLVQPSQIQDIYTQRMMAQQPRIVSDPGTLGGLNLGVFGRWGGGTIAGSTSSI